MRPRTSRKTTLLHRQDNDCEDVFLTDRTQGFQTVEPTFDPEDEDAGNKAQQEYIQSYIQEAEDAALLGRVRDDSRPSGWREVDPSEYFDYESAAITWLIQDFTKNPDNFRNGSAYYYKKANTETEKGKIHFGPVWDFDLAWPSNVYGYDGFYAQSLWTSGLLTDEDFVNEVIRQFYKEGGFRDQVKALVKDGGLMDQYAEEIKTSPRLPRPLPSYTATANTTMTALP